MTIAPMSGSDEVTLHRLFWVGPATVAAAVLAVLVVQKISLAMLGPIPRFSATVLESNEPAIGTGGDWRLVFSGGDPSGFRLILPDLRGHGRSTNPSRAFTFRQAALDMFALLDRLDIRHVKAIGLSMGAKTLLHIATLQPDRVEAMVLVSATPYFPAQARAAMAQLSVEAFSDADWAMQRQRHTHGDDQIRTLFEQMRGLKDSYDDMAFTPPLLATIAARTLIVHGDRDPLYPVELALEMYRAIPSSALWVVPNEGHAPIFGAMSAPFVETALAHLRGGPSTRLAGNQEQSYGNR